MFFYREDGKFSTAPPLLVILVALDDLIVILGGDGVEMLKATLQDRPYPLYVFGKGIPRLSRMVPKTSLALSPFHICKHTEEASELFPLLKKVFHK